MNGPEQKTAAVTAAEVVVKAAEAAREVSDSASTVAAEVVMRAAEAASEVAKTSDERVTRSLSDALREVFGEHSNSGRFIDVSRIPLICNNINTIHGDIKEIKEMMKENSEEYVRKDDFDLVKRVVFGFVALVMIGFVGVLISTTFK